jgi:UDP-3-O-[3-hydroxymyristoyl] N-acetylglucosamine deacetylase / 3-hydroxyacyl-[acyl-carrier-protein] dehydratase
LSGPAQRTIRGEVTVDGIGLHTGEPAEVRFRGAAAGTGVRFRRVDLEGAPEIPADLDHVVSADRGTSLGAGDARAHTVEHLLAAVAALELDNLWIDLTGPEAPIGDGSFAPFLERLAAAEAVVQDRPAKELRLAGPVEAAGPAGARYAAVPSESYRISAAIEFSHPLIGRQYGVLDPVAARFGEEVAAARTFGFEREAEALRSRGLALGATLENAIILGEEGLASGALRFPDEFVRHKIGDIVGDLALLGCRVRAHVLAERPSHAGNIALAKEMRRMEKTASAPIVDIQKILQYLPHRYPMLLVDRVVEFEPGKRIVGIKNVTINEPFFQGHYPGHPIMPGVLIIEAMAQVGGLLLMDVIEKPEEKVVYFMSLDHVKWRRPVTPGDQIRFELEVLQLRTHVCKMRGVGRVDGQVVAEAEMMARIMDR